MILILLACSSGPDAPERMQGLQEALELWRSSEEYREQGQLEASWSALEKALLADDQSPELWLSAGHALAALGRLEEAIQYAGKAIALRPNWHAAHYDRACWLSRTGALEQGVEDLVFALGEGGIDLLTAAADNDLDPIRADARFSDLLPEKALPSEITADEKSYFLGSEWSVELRFLNRPHEPVSLSYLGDVPLPAVHIRTVEDIVPQDGVNAHLVRYVFRVNGSGEGSVGPWRIAASGLDQSLSPVDFVFRTPPGHVGTQPSALSPKSFAVPSTLFGALDVHKPMRKGTQVLVKTRAGERVEWDAANVVHHEMRLQGQTEWLGWQGTLPEGASLRVFRGRSEIVIDAF